MKTIQVAITNSYSSEPMWTNTVETFKDARHCTKRYLDGEQKKKKQKGEKQQ